MALVGEWREDKMHGEGRMEIPSARDDPPMGETWEGTWVEGDAQGDFKITSKYADPSDASDKVVEVL